MPSLIQASFLGLSSRDLVPGDPLPDSAYSSAVFEGEDRPPSLEVAEIPAGTKSLVLTAEDIDAPGPVPQWLKVDILPTDCGRLSTAKSGTEVVRFTGPAPQDNFIHRFVFHVYALPRTVPKAKLTSWPVLKTWLQEQLEGGRNKTGQHVRDHWSDRSWPRMPVLPSQYGVNRAAHAEFLTTAVRHETLTSLL